MSVHKVTEALVIAAAKDLIEELGFYTYSLKDLAAKLGIKPPSLYNYVKSQEDLNLKIGLTAIKDFVQVQNQALEQDTTREQKILALAQSYRSFAKEKPELYKSILALHKFHQDNIENEIGHVIDPVLQVLSLYKLTDVQICHWQRIIRSTMHGFATFEEAGFFANHYTLVTTSKEESYTLAIRNIIVALTALERANMLEA